jgi:hypothetical protein
MALAWRGLIRALARQPLCDPDPIGTLPTSKRGHVHRDGGGHLLKLKTKLSASMTSTQFDNGYWYATELKDFAERIGIPAASKLRKVRRALPAQSLEGRSGRQWCQDHLPRFGERIRSTESDCRTIRASSPRAIHQLHERLHGCGAERHKRASDQGLDNAEGAGCAEGL